MGVMDGVTPFALQVSDLTGLDQSRAVEFLRCLLWAEAAEVGIGRNLIDVPDCINVADGGIDAVIRGASPTRDDIIPPGTSGFQIKSSDLPPQDCKQELLDFRKDEDNENVKQWIDEYVSSLDRQIEREKIDEERDDS